MRRQHIHNIIFIPLHVGKNKHRHNQLNLMNSLHTQRQDNRYIWILLVICVLSLIVFLGNALFNTKGEPREAIVAVSMLKYGNWILPINNGVDIAYKPPFFHWCIAFFSLLQGHVSEFTSRLPSALALIAMTLVGFKFFAKRRSPEIAFIACLVTLTSFEVHRAGTNCRVDMMLGAIMVIALYQLYKWGEKGLRGIPFTAVICMSGAFLTKGPVGIVLPCLVTAVFLWIRGFRFMRLLYKFALAAVLSCILPACWYVAAYGQGGETFLQLVYEENVLRFLGKMSYSSHEKPAFYNVVTVVSGYLPYTLMVIMSLFALKYKKPCGTLKSWWAGLTGYVKSMDGTRLFSLLCIVIIFVFYCIPKSKRSVYLLPIYPFIAYFLAEYIVYLAKNHAKVIRAFGYVLSGIYILLLVMFAAVRAGLVPHSIFTGRHAAENIAQMTALQTAAPGICGLVAIMLPVVAAIVFVASGRKSLKTQIYSMFGIIFAIFMSLDGFFLPAVLNTKSDKPIAQKLNGVVGDGVVYSYRPQTGMNNQMRSFTINYYMNDRVVPFEAVKPKSGYMLSGDDDIDVFKKTYPEYSVTEVIDFKHKSCDDKKMLRLYKVTDTSRTRR